MIPKAVKRWKTFSSVTSFSNYKSVVGFFKIDLYYLKRLLYKLQEKVGNDVRVGNGRIVLRTRFSGSNDQPPCHALCKRSNVCDIYLV